MVGVSCLGTLLLDPSCSNENNEEQHDRHEVKSGRRTSNRPHRLRILASNEEDDIPLAGIDIMILEEEKLVDAVFLQGAEFDEQTDGTS